MALFTLFERTKIINALRSSDGREIRKLITNKLCRREMFLMGIQQNLENIKFNTQIEELYKHTYTYKLRVQSQCICLCTT